MKLKYRLIFWIIKRINSGRPLRTHNFKFNESWRDLWLSIEPFLKEYETDQVTKITIEPNILSVNCAHQLEQMSSFEVKDKRV